jgi:hypothetical protein
VKDRSTVCYSADILLEEQLRKFSTRCACLQIAFWPTQPPVSRYEHMSASGLMSFQGIANVHCITFGAPPVASAALHTIAPTKPGRFWSIVNEGDPVPQAQEEFVKVLIKIYLMSRDEIERQHSNGLEIPLGHFRASGHPLILLDSDPDDMDAEGFLACTTSSSTLEKMLFGNPFVHPRAEYVRRVVQLAEANGLGSETSSVMKKEMVVEIGTEKSG